MISPRRALGLGSLLAVAVCVGVGPLLQSAFAQDPPADTDAAIAVPAAAENAPADPPPTAPESAPADAAPKPEVVAAKHFGWTVVIPPALTIVLAIVFRSVLPALTIGVLAAAFMLITHAPATETFGGGLIGGLRLATEGFLVGAMGDEGHIKTILFTFVIGGMVGVMGVSGGTQALVDRISRTARTRRSGQVSGWFAGMVVFFDDYANAMIIGPTLRPLYDRLRISRAKLAYIVDSTAAPVSSIALISTWIGMEVGLIGEGLKALDPAPAFLQGANAYSVFLRSIEYRYYAVLAIVMVLIVALLGRDFGPMRRAESEAPPPAVGPDETSAVPASRIWWALLPIVVLVIATVALLVAPGVMKLDYLTVEVMPGQPRWLAYAENVMSEADAYNSILYGALCGLATALAMTIFAGVASIVKTVDAATETMARMMPTLVVLVLAWTLSSAMTAIGFGHVAGDMLASANFNPAYLPLLVFSSACVVSFATGTSWGTMAILCPATVTISAGLLAGMPAPEALVLFYASVGAVLAGAVFGDHCSPISDTTVLSSLATECSPEQHVWTQMPYAIVVAIVSVLSWEVVCRQLGQPGWVGLVAGTGALLLIVLVVGRKPKYADAVPAA